MHIPKHNDPKHICTFNCAVISTICLAFNTQLVHKMSLTGTYKFLFSKFYLPNIINNSLNCTA